MRRLGPVMRSTSARRSSVAVLGLALALGGTALAAPATAAPPERTAVIVQLTPGSDAAGESRRASANGGGSVSHVYREVFRGFAGRFTERALNALRSNPNVILVEPDGYVARASVEQTGATWGLDRIDQRDLPLAGTYVYPRTGKGVTAYVVDTGIQAHSEFDGRLGAGMSVFEDGYGTSDCDGHGTHVAGTVGGKTYGVAKEVTLVPVRVLDCSGSGTWSGVIAGLDWVALHHSSGPAVANMSLGGSRNNSVDAAVQRVIDDGVTVVVAAGNSGRDACNYSPARVTAALTTGATDATDHRTPWSNYGSCLDLFAPGNEITSSWIGSLATETDTISGTSMAAPHVAGAAAVLLEKSPTLSPAGVSTTIKNSATTGAVQSPGRKSPNHLLYSPAG